MKENRILAINGSASNPSSNGVIIDYLAGIAPRGYVIEKYPPLQQLPHFETSKTDTDIPEIVSRLQQSIMNADAIIISTPEYVFSIPSALKNLIEWCVSTVVFSEKPVALITASSSGVKGHEEINLIMETLQAQVSESTNLLIQGIRAKLNADGKIEDSNLKNELKNVLHSLIKKIRT